MAAKSKNNKHMQQNPDAEHIPVIELDYTFGSERPGDVECKATLLVATDSIHSSVMAVLARKKGSQDECSVQSLVNYVDRLGLGTVELKCD